MKLAPSSTRKAATTPEKREKGRNKFWRKQAPLWIQNSEGIKLTLSMTRRADKPTKLEEREEVLCRQLKVEEGESSQSQSEK